MPLMPGSSPNRSPNLLIDTGSVMAPIGQYIFANYGVGAIEENGMFICVPLRIIFLYGPHNITKFPELTTKCRVIKLDRLELTVGELQTYLNTILIYREDKEYPLPARSYDSVGYDLYSTVDTIIAPGSMDEVPTGVYCAFPSHIWGLLVARSSTFKKGVVANTSIIDPGFQGHLFSACFNRSNQPFTVKKGDRLIQLIPIVDPYGVHLQEVEGRDEFPTTKRGAQGFGSTGK